MSLEFRSTAPAVTPCYTRWPPSLYKACYLNPLVLGGCIRFSLPRDRLGQARPACGRAPHRRSV